MRFQVTSPDHDENGHHRPSFEQPSFDLMRWLANAHLDFVRRLLKKNASDAAGIAYNCLPHADAP
eukprot:4928691-Pyramimonas_sp.AAC.1